MADGTTETGSTFLSEEVMPGLEEINAQAEFTGRSITKQEFEAIWSQAWEWFDD